MKLAVLYSGGKDSNYALYKAQSYGHEIKCLINVKSKNNESYMFQSPGAGYTKFQSQSLDIPIITKETLGEKEKEIQDLKDAIIDAIKNYKIEGIVTGAIKSVYQASRIQNICNELDIWCFNPLWQINEEEFIQELISNEFKVMIIGIAAYPLDKSFIGKYLDTEMLKKLKKLSKEYGLSIAGEGGEFETFVLDSPIFDRRLIISNLEIEYSNNSGELIIKEMEAIPK